MVQLIRIGAVVVVLCLLAACGSGAESDTSAAQTPGTSRATPNITAETPRESPSAVDGAPTVSGSMSSTTPAADAIGSLTRSGGLQGKTQTLIVQRDGTLLLLNGDVSGQVFKTARAAPAQLQPLQTTFASAEWQQLGESYGKQVPDGFAYTIVGAGKQVRTYDAATKPPVLEEALRQLNELWQLAQTAP